MARLDTPILLNERPHLALRVLRFFSLVAFVVLVFALVLSSVVLVSSETSL